MNSAPGPAPPGPAPPGPAPPAKAPAHSLHAGGALLVVATALGAAYVIGGVVLNKHKGDGRSGLGLVPHRAFWAALPGLARDGFVYTFAFARAKAGGGSHIGSTGYDSL